MRPGPHARSKHGLVGALGHCQEQAIPRAQPEDVASVDEREQVREISRRGRVVAVEVGQLLPQHGVLHTPALELLVERLEATEPGDEHVGRSVVTDGGHLVRGLAHREFRTQRAVLHSAAVRAKELFAQLKRLGH